MYFRLHTGKGQLRGCKETVRQRNSEYEWIRRFHESGCVRRLDNIDYQLRRVSRQRVSFALSSSNSSFREQIAHRIDQLFAVNRYLVCTSYVRSEFKVRGNLAADNTMRSHGQSKYYREHSTSLPRADCLVAFRLIDTNCSSKLFPISCFQPFQLFI